MRVAITGSSGLIGTALAGHLRSAGTEVIRLVRRPPATTDEVRWDPAADDGGLRWTTLRRVDAVVHLSGAPVAGGRWTAARKRVLRASRIDSTAALVRVLLAADDPPPVLLDDTGTTIELLHAVPGFFTQKVLVVAAPW